MTETELAHLFMRYRPHVVRSVGNIYTLIDLDTLDNLYADLWQSLIRMNSVRKDTLKTMLTEALKNKVKNYMRDNMSSHDVMKRFPLASLSDEAVVDEVEKTFAKDNDPRMVLDPNESDERYEAIMSGLPPTLRLVAELYYIDECTQEEIACHLGTYRIKVLRMIARATKLLRERYLYYNQAKKNGDL